MKLNLVPSRFSIKKTYILYNSNIVWHDNFEHHMCFWYIKIELFLRTSILQERVKNILIKYIICTLCYCVCFTKWKIHEVNYPTHDMELATIVFTLKIWLHYLYGTSFKVLSDHKSLKYIFPQRELNMRQRRWLELIND